METALDMLIHPLLECKTVSNDFKAAILRREALASTVWGQTALPRAPEYSAMDDTISILLSDKPLPWGNVNVLAVILFTSRSGHYHTHCLRILHRLIHVLQEKGGRSKLFHCQSYEDFCYLMM